MSKAFGNERVVLVYLIMLHYYGNLLVTATSGVVL